MADTPPRTPITFTFTFTCTCTPRHDLVSECPAYLASPEYLAHQDELLKATQEREDYLIDEYSCVLDVMQKKYNEVQGRLSDLTADNGAAGEVKQHGGWRATVLEAVLAHVREVMCMNELVLEEGRRELWGDHQHMEDSVRLGEMEGSTTAVDGTAKGGEGEVEVEVQRKDESAKDVEEKMEEGKDVESVFERSLVNRKGGNCEWETLERHAIF